MNKKGQALSSFTWQLMMVILIIASMLVMYFAWRRLIGMPS